MKLSLKFEDDPHDPYHHRNENPILKAKIPVTIFNQPFVSSTTATAGSSPSDLSFSLSTSFPSGPSLKLSYSPTPTTAASTPFSLSLKSGLGLFGSPHNSPLVFSAHFSFSPTSTPIPTFSLHLKPQFGHFSLKRSTFSDPGSNQISGPFSNGGDKVNYGSFSNGGEKVNSDCGSHANGEFGNGFALDGSSVWQELKLEPCSSKDGVTNPDFRENCGIHSNDGIGFVPERQLAWKNSGKDGFLSGVAVMARTVLPVTKRVMVNLRWGVNFPSDLGKRMPYLTVSKIGIQRVQQVKEVEKMKNSGESNAGDLDLLKGMWFWMRRDLEVLEKENKEMNQSLEEMRTRISAKKFRGDSDGVRKNVSPPTSESSSTFEQWRSKKSGGEENGRRESKKSLNQVSDMESELQRALKADVESELQRAIKAASS
ncbi:uncharacterized protein LOC132174151 [Corylus avellana]|uniref:uncharacterized protein LOC132174151 n=1 Tax=Corylus avellana TaxID=13451 RepID=UPI001E1ECA2C|nr:uncharacterized protein LOC132174151 [Corylus avellana]